MFDKNSVDGTQSLSDLQRAATGVVGWKPPAASLSSRRKIPTPVNTHPKTSPSSSATLRKVTSPHKPRPKSLWKKFSIFESPKESKPIIAVGPRPKRMQLNPFLHSLKRGLVKRSFSQRSLVAVKDTLNLDTNVDSELPEEYHDQENSSLLPVIYLRRHKSVYQAQSRGLSIDDEDLTDDSLSPEWSRGLARSNSIGPGNGMSPRRPTRTQPKSRTGYQALPDDPEVPNYSQIPAFNSTEAGKDTVPSSPTRSPRRQADYSLSPGVMRGASFYKDSESLGSLLTQVEPSDSSDSDSDFTAPTVHSMRPGMMRGQSFENNNGIAQGLLAGTKAESSSDETENSPAPSRRVQRRPPRGYSLRPSVVRGRSFDQEDALVDTMKKGASEVVAKARNRGNSANSAVDPDESSEEEELFPTPVRRASSRRPQGFSVRPEVRGMSFDLFNDRAKTTAQSVAGQQEDSEKKSTRRDLEKATTTAESRKSRKYREKIKSKKKSKTKSAEKEKSKPRKGAKKSKNRKNKALTERRSKRKSEATHSHASP